MQNEYNGQVFQLRKEKSNLYQYIESKKEELSNLHAQLPTGKRKNFTSLPEINMDNEYPEDALKVGLPIRFSRVVSRVRLVLVSRHLSSSYIPQEAS